MKKTAEEERATREKAAEEERAAREKEDDENDEEDEEVVKEKKAKRSKKDKKEKKKEKKEKKKEEFEEKELKKNEAKEKKRKRAPDEARTGTIDELLANVGSRNYQKYAISDNPITFPENMMVHCEKGSNQREYDSEWVTVMAAKIEETGKSLFSQPMAATLLETHVRFLSKTLFCLVAIVI